MITLDVDQDQALVLLRGNVSLLKEENSVLWTYLSSVGFVPISGNIAAVPYSADSEICDFISSVEEICDDFNIKMQKSSAIAEACKEVQLSQENFTQQTAVARNIREGHIKKNELRDFREVVGKALSRRLHRQQELSSFHMAYAQNVCNFSVPGAGKTSIVYGAFTYLKDITAASENYDKRVDKLFVIAPLAAFAPWKKEYEACFGFSPSVKDLGGVGLEERKRYFQRQSKPDLTLITYQSAFSSIDDIENYLQQTEDRVMMVLDEAHRIKNQRGRQAQAILPLAKYAKARIVLTGTPVPNSYADLANLFEFIWPGKNLVNKSERDLKSLSSPDSADKFRHVITELTERIKPYFTRIKKKDLDIPKPQTPTKMQIEMNHNQRIIYEYTAYKCLL